MRAMTPEAIYESIATSQCEPFWYDREEQVFNMGNLEFRLSKDLGSDIFAARDELMGIPAEELPKFPLVQNFTGELYSLPRFTEYYWGMDLGEMAALRQDITLVMREALDEMTDYEQELQSAYFDVYLSPGHPYSANVFLMASLHEIAEGTVGEAGWQHNIFEYGTNNADLPEWEVALQAGIGHLATLAARES